ncbi:MAG: murein biosynthesis integral membrane protein MurJ, partial [Syntrophomonadaceae bacterium]|nr:murein biosynthesis integral membrane protein MurJ [Syntrophomonadaceae bacterium]
MIIVQQGKSVARAALVIMAAATIARILGYVRDVAIYTRFGQNYATDAFNAAFSIPDFIYMLLVGGALSSAFIPVFSGYLAVEKREQAWKTASVIFNFTMVGMLVLIAGAYVFTRPLIMLLVPRLPHETIDLAVTLTRIMFVQTMFMALNGLAMGVLNSHKEFVTPALGGILYNVGIITVGLALSDRWGIAAFSVGVVVGALMSVAVQVPALLRVRPSYSFSFDWRDQGFREIMVLMLPVLIGLSVTQFNLFVSQNLASGLGSGTISALKLAQRIMQLPLGIFAVSVAIAVFPTLTGLVARNQMSEFKQATSLGVRTVFFIILPSALGLMALREPIIALLFQQGSFTVQNTQTTAWALFYYALGLFAYSALQVLNRAFYAIKDTVTPVATGVATIAINIGLSVWLVRLWGYRGLALAYSVAGTLNMMALLVLLRMRVGAIGGRRIAQSFALSLGASLVMYVTARSTALGLLHWLPLAAKLSQLVAVFAAITLGVVVYGGIALLVRM